MQEHESEAENKFSKKTLTFIFIGLILVIGYFAVFLPIRTHTIDNNCTKQAQAPYAAWQYQDIESLYNQQQPPTGLPFSPAEYRVVAYNSCVSSSNSWF